MSTPEGKRAQGADGALVGGLVTHEGPAKVARRGVPRPATADILQDESYLRAYGTAVELTSEWLQEESVDSLIRHWDETINHLERRGFELAAVPCRGYRDALVEYRDQAGGES